MITFALAAGLLAAHPLGNFTVNHYDGLVATPHELRIDHVEDLAEIPAAQAIPDVDTDRDGRPSAAELDAWADGPCRRAASSMRITVDGRAVTASVESAKATAPAGQAGLPTLRVECRITAPAEPGTISFQAGTTGRIGWREITAQGDRMTLNASDVPAASRSWRLTAYPEGMLSSPLDQRSATLTVRAGGPPLTAAPASGGGPERLLPRGTDGLTQRFTSLVARHDLTPGFAVLAFLIAMTLGALHALAPGHGKTIMAAHAVGEGRRRTRDVLALGLTVTLTHTAGVLALGLLVTTGALLAPDALFPWLGAAGGVLVSAAGVLLLRRALRNRHHHAHGHGHGHTSGGRRGGVVLMGLAGGMVPSPSAVVVLVGGAAIGRAWFGVVLVLAYGLGLAAALVTVALLVVGSGRVVARRILARRPRIPSGMMPIGTSATVVALGVGLTLRSLVL
ncbi:hypothetical protein [Actinomadura sp. 3N407]|uniref:hypothetical protein n=1 Tax=Actinomadura sp. 3N407 TaxID=3457423 RepID=UPI003FCC49E8